MEKGQEAGLEFAAFEMAPVGQFAQGFGHGLRDFGGLSVHEETPLAEQELAAGIQPHALGGQPLSESSQGQGATRRIEEHMGLGFAQVATQEIGDVGLVPTQDGNGLARPVDHGRGNLAGVGGALQAGIRVHAFQFQVVLEVVEKAGRDFLGLGSTEAHRPSHAVGQGDAVVGESGRQVQHVPGFHFPGLVHAETLQDTERRAVHHLQVVLAADFPSPPAQALDEEHVVGIEVGSDTAAGWGEAHHQIVQSRLGDEIEAVQQLVALGQQVVHAGDQQAPAALGQGIQVFTLEGAVVQLALLALEANQPAFRVVPAGQVGQAAPIQPVAEAGEGLAHQQRLLLPVLGKKPLGGESAQQTVEGEIRHGKAGADGRMFAHIILSIYPEERRAMLKTGDKAPDFELPDADMTIAKLADYRGKPLVLFFYVRDDTPGCTTEAIEFSDLEGDFGRLECAVVGVSRDDCIRHGAFRDKHGITVRLLADKDGIACQAYGVIVQKEVDGVMREGVSRTTYIIDAGGVIRHVLQGVTPKGHAAEVLELVKEL